MTCIVGMINKKDNNVLIGGDNYGVSGYSVEEILHAKVFKKISNNHNIVIGYTSSFRMGQLLQFSENLFTDNEIDFKYMITKFVPKIIKIFEENGYLTKKDEEKTGGSFIVGVNNRLFKIQDDFAVFEYNNYCSVGCGDQLALGSLFSTESLNTEDRIKIAIESAKKFNSGVGGKVVILGT